MDFLPHRVCYLYNAQLAAMIGCADLAIGAAYWLIAWGLFGIAVELRRREADGWQVILGAARPWMAVAFGSFILLCGLGHWIDVLTLFRGWYYVTAAIRIATAVASVGTALACSHVLWEIRGALDAER